MEFIRWLGDRLKVWDIIVLDERGKVSKDFYKEVIFDENLNGGGEWVICRKVILDNMVNLIGS